MTSSARLIGGVLVIAGAASPATAATLYVNGTCGNDVWSGTSSTCTAPDGPKAHIQAAITAAGDGDTVLVAAGTYFEAIDYQGNLLDTTSIAGTSSLVERPLQDPPRITELLYNPTAPSQAELAAGFSKRSEFEFVEFFNGGDEPLDLTGVQITSGVDFSFLGSPSPSLAPGEYALGVRNELAFGIGLGVGPAGWSAGA